MPLQGHAVEARIYAEDPARGFLPSTGTLLALQFPDGVRVDTGVEQGSAITPYYDPMIAKMIAHAPTREAALGQARRPRWSAPSPPAPTPIWRCSRRSAARPSSAPENSTPVSSNGTWRRFGRRQRRPRGGGVWRGRTAGARRRPHRSEPRPHARRASLALGRDRRLSALRRARSDAADPGRWRGRPKLT